jgi:hypothetical protein
VGFLPDQSRATEQPARPETDQAEGGAMRATKLHPDALVALAQLSLAENPAPVAPKCFLPEMDCVTVERYQGDGKWLRVITCFYVQGELHAVSFGLN